jgi:hypothetical protein
MALGTPIGGIRVDLQLNSAAFIRDIAKTNAAIAGSTRQMTSQLTKLQKASQAVGATFGAWVTLRATRRVINFLDQSIELAAKLQNQLGESARAFEASGAAMSNSFKLGLAQGFLDAIAGGGEDATKRMQQLAQAGLIAGKVLGAAFTVVVDILTIVIPESINLALIGINKLVEGANAIIAKGEAIENALGLNKDYGRIPMIPIEEINAGTAAFFSFADAERLATDAGTLAADSQKKVGDATKNTTDKIINQLAAMDALRQASFKASIETTQQWLTVADTVGQALGTLFKDSKAVAIAQAVINTAEAITRAMTLPFPLNWAQVAAVTALGAAQIATIASANPGGGAKAIKKGSSGGSKTQKAVSDTSTSSGGAVAGQAVNITLVGQGGFDREQVRALIGQINSAVGDGATLRVSG